MFVTLQIESCLVFVFSLSFLIWYFTRYYYYITRQQQPCCDSAKNLPQQQLNKIPSDDTNQTRQPQQGEEQKNNRAETSKYFGSESESEAEWEYGKVHASLSNTPFVSTSAVSREVIQMDAIAWLRSVDCVGGCVVVSPPDVIELCFPLRPEDPTCTSVRHASLDEWRTFYTDAIYEMIVKTRCDGVVIVYCTDCRNVKATEWVSKSALVFAAIQRAQARLIWHKVVSQTDSLDRPKIRGKRAGYSHLLCISGMYNDPNVPNCIAHQENLMRAKTDVIAGRGGMLWPRGMGLKACFFAVQYILDQTPHRLVVDPFCGKGTALAVANELGLHALGVELSARRASCSAKVKISPRMRKRCQLA